MSWRPVSPSTTCAARRAAVASRGLLGHSCCMPHGSGPDGATEAIAGSATLEAEPDGLAQRRLLYAERCENLIQALQFVAAVLRKTPVGGNEAREAIASWLSENLPAGELQAAFERIDATWAAWNRPDIGARNRESVERHARMALLAAVDQAAKVLRLLKVARAQAKRRAGQALDTEEKALLAKQPEATAAEGLLDGKPQLVWTLCGDLQYEFEDTVTVETAANAERQRAIKLVRWLTRANGYPDLAMKLTDEQIDRLVQAWPKRAGRPRGGQPASWDIITDVLTDLGLGGTANVRKAWEAFRRENGMSGLPS
jgi:hypothetical protein